MSDLICVGYDDMDTADKVLNRLRSLELDFLVDLEDACVAVRNEKGEVHLKQTVNVTERGAAFGGAWGFAWGGLIGAVLANPLAGAITGSMVGAGSGALSASLGDYGIDDDFVRSIGKTLRPGSSALFVLVNSVNLDEALPRLKKFNGHLLRTTLTRAEEDQLRAKLEQ